MVPAVTPVCLWLPACSTALAPSMASVTPTLTLTVPGAPLAPSAAVWITTRPEDPAPPTTEPVAKVTSPVLPMADVPELNTSGPDCSVAGALADRTTMAPDDPDVPAPVRSATAPPT